MPYSLIDALTQDERNWLHDNGFIEDENGTYLYESRNKVHSINLAAILSDYRDFLEDKNQKS